MGRIRLLAVGEIARGFDIWNLDLAEFLEHLGMDRKEPFSSWGCAFSDHRNRKLEQADHVGLEPIARAPLAPGAMHHAVGDDFR